MGIFLKIENNLPENGFRCIEKITDFRLMHEIEFFLDTKSKIKEYEH